jgi:hypothetical protein
MAAPKKPASAKKTPYAVSLSMAERAFLQAMGGSKWLQDRLLHAARVVASVDRRSALGRAAMALIEPPAADAAKKSRTAP